MIAARTVGALIAVVALAGCASGTGAPLADGSDSSVQAAINDVTTFPTELDPRLWDGTDLKPEVRERSLAIVDRIVRTSGIPGLTVDAVELFEVVFHGERTETYQPTPGIEQYSLTYGRWIERPTQQPDRFDRSQMASDMKSFIGKYNALVSDYTRDRAGFACSRFGDLDHEMSRYRNTGFANGSGSRSTQNLAYRALRRINVNIPENVDTLEDECTFAQESIG